MRFDELNTRIKNPMLICMSLWWNTLWSRIDLVMDENECKWGKMLLLTSSFELYAQNNWLLLGYVTAGIPQPTKLITETNRRVWKTTDSATEPRSFDIIEVSSLEGRTFIFGTSVAGWKVGRLPEPSWPSSIWSVCWKRFSPTDVRLPDGDNIRQQYCFFLCSFLLPLTRCTLNFWT